MEFQLKKYIGEEAATDGWRGIISKNKVQLKNEKEIVQLEVKKDNAIIKIEGESGAIIIRDNKIASLTNGSSGKIVKKDVIWLLSKETIVEFNQGIRQNFKGAGIMVEFIDRNTNKQEIFIKERSIYQEKSNKKINLILGLVVFGFLITGTILGYQKKSKSEEIRKFEEIKNEISRIKTEIKGVRSVNIETALELAKNADIILDNSELGDDKYGQELLDLKNEIAEIKKGLGGEYIDYEIAYDTALINEKGQFAGMAVKDNIIYLWSNNLGQINLIDIKLKSTEKILNDDVTKLWLGIFNNGDRWYGYDQDKIYEIKRNDLVETNINEINNVGEIRGWNGIFYIVNNDIQNIEKISRENRTVWLKEGTRLSEEAKGMSIDGSIWVLGKSGKIYHYNLGLAEKFEMSFVPSLVSAKNLVTSEQVDFLAYVADNNSVLIYGKDGKILGKYNFGKIKINDLGIDEQNNAVLVLAENGKIYRIKIK